MTTTTNTPNRTLTTQVHRVYIKATPEAVWEAITSPEWTQKYAYRSRGEYDLRPGGAYRAHASKEMRAMGTPDVVVDGEVIEVDPPRRLVQTWHMNFTPEMIAERPTTVTFEIEPENDGLTRLTVTHDVEDAPIMATLVAGAGDEKVNEGGGGWPWILSDLKTLLETGTAIED